MSECTLTSSYSIFIAIVLLLIFLWSISSFVVIFLDNFFYRTIDFDITNTWDTLCVAVCVILLFLAFTYIVKYSGILPDLETRLIGVKAHGPKGAPRGFGIIDVTQNAELQGGIVASSNFLTQLRAERL